MQTIYLDISNKGVIPTIYAKQGDVGRKFRVVFTNAGLPYDLENSLFSVWYNGDSGEGNYTHIGENSAFSIQKNTVEVEMISQMLSVCGSGIVCLVLSSGDKQIGSWNIPYVCEEIPGFESESAKEYYTAFSETVEKLNGLIDKSISLGDYIEEQGKTDIWSWRKWASGVAEIWGTVTSDILNSLDDNRHYRLPFVMFNPSENWPAPNVTYSAGNAFGLINQETEPNFFDIETIEDEESGSEIVVANVWRVPSFSFYDPSVSNDGALVNYTNDQYTIDVRMVGRWKPIDNEPSREILAVNVGGNGAAIDDENISTETTWSSQKISNEIGKGGGGGGSADAVLYTKQTLTEAQKTQARENIGATLDVLKAMGKETKRVDNLDEVTENGFYIGNIPDYEGEWYCIATTGSDDYKIQLCINPSGEFGFTYASMLLRTKQGDDEWWYYEVGLDVANYCMTLDEFYNLFGSELDSYMEYITQSVIGQITPEQIGAATQEELDELRGGLGECVTYSNFADAFTEELESQKEGLIAEVISALPVYEGED